MNAKSAWFVPWCLLYVIGGEEEECFVICRVFDFDKVGIEWDVGIDDIFHVGSPERVVGATTPIQTQLRLIYASTRSLRLDTGL